MKKRVFIGDVQGCRRELDMLLDRLSYDPAQMELWFVGDLVNRGPDSAGVLRRAIELEANSVLGNHDLNLLALAAGQRSVRPLDTFESVLDEPDGEELLRWLRHRPLLQSWDDLILVHAGLHPRWDDAPRRAQRLERRIQAGELPLDDPDLQFMVSVRMCSKKGKRAAPGKPPKKSHRPWDEFYRGTRVVCGHWAQRGLVCNERVVSLDTGCVWGGRLTAWVAEDDDFIDVPAVATYATP